MGYDCARSEKGWQVISDLKASQSGTIFSQQFTILCISSILFMASFSMLLPELPEYLSMLGGAQYLGYIVGLFTVTAGISRLFSGKLTDSIGRTKVILFGTAITAIAGGLYLLSTSIIFFMIIRLFHGFSTGFRPTGTSALLTDIVPVSKRGEAMGYLGVAGSLGMAGGPALGSFIREDFSLDAMFLTSSGIGVLALLMSLLLKESLPNPKPFTVKSLNPFKGKALTTAALPAAILILLETFAFGVIITLSPIVVDELGLKYKGMFNLTFVLVSLVLRMVAGRASDRYSRTGMLLIGSMIMIASMLLLGMAESLVAVLWAGALYGVSVGINRPTIFAWTTELAPEGQIGLALSTMLLGLEIGIGAGAWVSGAIYGGDLERIHLPFYLAAILGGIGVLYLIYYRTTQKRNL